MTNLYTASRRNEVTYSAKYGSLSTSDGRISVRWYPLLNGNADARLCIEWQETVGPSVQASERSGYGMEVIRGLLPYELDGKVGTRRRRPASRPGRQRLHKCAPQ
jgi:two-component sensor histidine kinase